MSKLDKKLTKTSDNFNEVVANLRKDFGKEAIVSLTDIVKTDQRVVSTGSINLDLALGIGGLPFGRIVEIYGPEASGKTTLTLHTIANVQKQGGLAAFVDAEHAFDINYAQALGVDVGKLIFAQPGSGEEALGIVDKIVESRQADIVVIDSVAALTPAAELEGDMDRFTVGAHARLMGKALRKITGDVSKGNTLVMFINQLRENIGVTYGSPETTPGGKALKFFCSVRLDIRKKGWMKYPADNIIGTETKVKVVKNKMAPPMQVAEFSIYYGKGIWREKEILDLGVTYGILTKTGGSYADGDTKYGRNFKASADFLTANPKVLEDLHTRVMAKIDSKAKAIDAIINKAEVDADETLEE